MREYKFRAFNRTTKHMFWSLHPSLANVPNWNGEFWDVVEADPDNYEVMQYVGIKDSGNVELYEDDIFEAEEPRFESGVNNYLVVCDDGCFLGKDLGSSEMFPLHEWLEKSAEFTIVGNRWENPELLVPFIT